MSAWSLLELVPATGASQPISEGQTEIEALRHHQREVEDAIDDLNRRITAAVVAELQQGSLSEVLAGIIEARDLIRARLTALEGASHG